jgi:hypothetical protein
MMGATPTPDPLQKTTRAGTVFAENRPDPDTFMAVIIVLSLLLLVIVVIVI